MDVFISFYTDGFYAYIETSSPRRQGDNAKLEFSGKDLNSDAIRISFYYHMFGANVGSLKVFVNGQQEFSKSGSQGNKWVMADFKVQKRLTNVSNGRARFTIYGIAKL